jgi:hypothetical protein
MGRLAFFANHTRKVMKAAYNFLTRIQDNGLLNNNLGGFQPKLDKTGAKFADQVAKAIGFAGVSMRLIDPRQHGIAQIGSRAFGPALLYFIDKCIVHIAQGAKAANAHTKAIRRNCLTDNALARIAFGFGISHVVGSIRKGALRMQQARSCDQQCGVNAHLTSPKLCHMRP